jgi:hypothetical protein
LRYVLICLLFAGQTRAEEWTNTDTAWEATFLLFLAADWGQTLYIAGHGEEHVESNKILGAHPSRARVNTAMLLAGAGHIAVSRWLPSEAEIFGISINPRRIWQFVWIGIEANAVRTNYRAGVKFDF